MNINDYKLCYVKDGCAWFTPVPLEKQWGDDWNDVPYEHNASEPYDDTRQPDGTYVKHELVRVMFRGGVDEPCERRGFNSPYSVEGINRGETPWLASRYDSHDSGLYAGATVSQFMDYAAKMGAELFLPKELWAALSGAQ